MIVALDIETIGNKDAVALMPQPTASGRLKDPAKIAADIAEKTAAMFADAALDPLTARVACYAIVGMNGGETAERSEIITAATDDEERGLLQGIMRVLGTEELRLVTWNGIGFDLPMIYKRALILGVDPANFGAPPLSAWTKRYATDRHYDLMQVWGGWRDYVKLDTVARLVLGASKAECDVTTIADLIATDEGRAKVADYCVQDTRLTWQLWNRFNGFLFS